MKFVDEVRIDIAAGAGGHGACSFRREKYVPRGGPDGGDGGHGGDVYIQASSGLSTLVDYRYVRRYQAESGVGGMGRQRNGRNGEDLYLKVPLGTVVYDHDLNECLGEVVHDGETLLVAHGGKRGLGNTRFKSSVNQAPRQFTRGEAGEKRTLRLELKVLADVGLLGLPNAGKSTFLRAVSSAKPKVADYAFTTLYPHLGVVDVDREDSFVIADIPGIIEGAAEGAGLGIQFLKHLSRTRLLLHIVDIGPHCTLPPEEAVVVINEELRAYGDALDQRERWLVLNKVDTWPEEEREEKMKSIIASLQWDGPWFGVCALHKEGVRELIYSVMKHLNSENE